MVTRERRVQLRPSVRPVGYRRGVTDFTGRRANEKLVGCEAERARARAREKERLLTASHPVPRTPLLDNRARSLLSDIPSYRQLPRARHYVVVSGSEKYRPVSIIGLQQLLPWSRFPSESLLSDRGVNVLLFLNGILTFLPLCMRPLGLWSIPGTSEATGRIVPAGAFSCDSLNLPDWRVSSSSSNTQQEYQDLKAMYGDKKFTRT